MLIELAPVLSKLLLNTKVYNQRLILEEGYLLNLDREVFEKKYSEARKYSDAMHQSNLDAINKIFEKSNSMMNQSSNDEMNKYELHHGKPATVNSLLTHMKQNLMGRHTSSFEQ